jgi:3-hydroxyisobutyrate dehydrogenase-like beta-hydroxyacid dehydrogenase
MPLAQNSRINVGVIGLGIIGSRVAAALRHEGFPTSVWNRTPKAIPNFLASPAEVAGASQVIQLFVADAAATLAMIDAMGDRLTRDHVVLSHGTIGLEGTLEAAERVRKRGARFLDAPFTGSKGAAENRQLVYYLGGDSELALRVRPVLEASSKGILHVGEIGQAAVVKIATNMISAATAQVLAEALALTVKSGVRGEALAEAIALNAMRSGVTDLKLPKMLNGDYEPHFSLKHMLKDVQLGMHLAKQLGIELPATATVTQELAEGAACGWGDLDYAAVAKGFERGNSPARA